MSARTSMLSLAAVAAAIACGTASAADTFKVDGVHSSVVYRVKHMGTSNHWGRFNDLSGTFSLDEANPAKSSLDFAIKTDSIDSGNPKRDQHLKSPDFFNAVQYPTITFKSKGFAKSGATYDVSGDLTFHGVTKPITVKVTPVGTGKDMKGTPTAGIDATFTIKQTEFGITKMTGPTMIGDDVLVIVGVEGQKQ